VEYPSPSRRKFSTTEQASHKPEIHVKRRQSEYTVLTTSLIISYFSNVSLSGWLALFPACHWKAETEEWLRPTWSNMSAPLCVFTRIPFSQHVASRADPQLPLISANDNLQLSSHLSLNVSTFITHISEV
uniref:Ovule protein n=1 Tax=Mesocestoides corti TaxID=53468 RepID=A0A5K3FDU5_MESCO